MTLVYSDALQTIVDEFRTLSPETSNVLLFKKSGQPMASTGAAFEGQTKQFITNFEYIALQAESIGGIENLAIQAADNQLNITAMRNYFLATLSSRSANQEIVGAMTNVVVPLVVGLVDQIDCKVSEKQLQSNLEIKQVSEETVLALEKPEIEPIPEPQPPFEPFLPKTPINQLMVEKIGGLLVPVDTVRIDSEVIARWSEVFDGKQITLVNIEALDGKKTVCKFKAMKETKSNVKGIIQIPEKILQTLQTEKGKLVIVKPVID